MLVWNQKHSEMLATHRQNGSDAKDGNTGALRCQTPALGSFLTTLTFSLAAALLGPHWEKGKAHARMFTAALKQRQRDPGCLSAGEG